MAEIFRTRDVIVFFKGATFTVEVTQDAAVSGWHGGQCFQWAPPVGDQLIAKISDGLYGGFALYGSDESSDEFTSMTRNQPTYKYVTLGAGGWIIATSSYERYTYQSRIGGGPLVPIVYNSSDRLVISLSGRLTKQDEWTISGDPRAPNNYYLAFVVQKPIPARNDFITVQISI
jgi:hypothetical protein